MQLTQFPPQSTISDVLQAAVPIGLEAVLTIKGRLQYRANTTNFNA
jgi:hypothetical protein